MRTIAKRVGDLKMTLTYFKRYRMQIETESLSSPLPSVPEFIQILPWRDELVRSHAKVKFEAFRNEIDATVFPCLGQAEGCLKLMNDIRRRSNFVPEATLLATIRDDRNGANLPIGTIQGLRPNVVEGAIQNIGIIPEYRGRGIGRLLLQFAVNGFAQAGCKRVSLEVTTQNTAAIAMYASCGFRQVETVYKASDIAFL